MLFQRKTLKRAWVWATPFVCNPHILQVDVRPNELTFSRLSGVEAATMPVTDGTTKWMEVVEFLMKALKYPSEFHFKLLVEGRVVGPRREMIPELTTQCASFFRYPWPQNHHRIHSVSYFCFNGNPFLQEIAVLLRGLFREMMAS